ncbi:type VI secretion system contractile sheath small subunit [Sphingomonas sp.]|uniref:type VI secretion system contractile sheath small subunit n=1 Tax=Sphingomonas sp. TaxID=28214 RepID=UPI003B007BDF
MPLPSPDTMTQLPKVHIRYQPQTGDATQIIDLPFVFGAFLDLSGDNPNRPDADKRPFAPVVGGNVNKLMGAIAPELDLRDLPNHLVDGGDPLNVKLKFTALPDMTPKQIVANVPVLKELMQVAGQLDDLAGTTSQNGMRAEDALGQILRQVLALREP